MESTETAHQKMEGVPGDFFVEECDEKIIDRHLGRLIREIVSQPARSYLGMIIEQLGKPLL